MSRVIRISDETFERLRDWAEAFWPVDEALARVLDAAEERELRILECGVCGKRAPMTDAVMDTWHPDVWAEYDDGSPSEEVSPVCDEHEVGFDEETGVGIIRLPRPREGEAPSSA